MYLIIYICFELLKASLENLILQYTCSRCVMLKEHVECSNARYLGNTVGEYFAMRVQFHFYFAFTSIISLREFNEYQRVFRSQANSYQCFCTFFFFFFADFSKSNLSDVELLLNYGQEQIPRLLLIGLPEALFFTPSFIEK